MQLLQLSFDTLRVAAKLVHVGPLCPFAKSEDTKLQSYDSVTRNVPSLTPAYSSSAAPVVL